MGTVNVLKAVIPGMVTRQQGHIVVISSVMAIIGGILNLEICNAYACNVPGAHQAVHHVDLCGTQPSSESS